MAVKKEKAELDAKDKKSVKKSLEDNDVNFSTKPVHAGLSNNYARSQGMK